MFKFQTRQLAVSEINLSIGDVVSRDLVFRKNATPENRTVLSYCICPCSLEFGIWYDNAADQRIDA